MGTVVISKRASIRTNKILSKHFEPLESRQMMSITPLTPPSGSAALTGTLIGTAGSYQNKGNTIANAMDGNPNTYFDGPASSGGWAGLDLGTPTTITQVQFVPRSGLGSRMVGGLFQGSNTADFSSGVTTLAVVTSSPTATAYTALSITNTAAFRYVRYLSPAGAYGNVAELEFDGKSVVAVTVPSTPAGLSAFATGSNDITLSWAADSTSIITSYTIEREGPTDTSYVSIGSAAANATSYDDLTVAASTSYSYEIVANNNLGSSFNSLSASATTPAAAVKPNKLTGTIIGSAGSYKNQGNTIANVFDGNFNTYFDAPTNTGWMGLDLGQTANITQIQYAPRPGVASRMVGGVFQGSSTPDFSTGVINLYTVTSAPASGVFTTVPIISNTAVRYVRYASPVNAFGNVAEIEFDGTIVITPPPVPMDSAVAKAVSATDVNITWTAVHESDAVSFTILRQGPTDATFVAIGTAPAGATTYDDLTVAPTTAYSYQVVVNQDNQGDSFATISANTVAVPAIPVATLNLTGTVIGTAGSYKNGANTIAKVFDGDATTFFDAPTASGSWVGLDLGSPQQITQISYTPRSGLSSRMVGGMFQASNTADFSAGVVTLLTLDSTLVSSGTNTQPSVALGGYRYVRYVGPNNGYCNVAEISFVGLPAAVIQPSTNFPTTIAWANGAPSPIVRAEAVGATVNGIVYAFGGFNNQGSDTTSIPLQSECDSYNPATNTWTRLQDFPEPFTHSEEVVVGSKIWFVGGYIGNHPGPGTTHVWVYDTTSDSWSRGPDLPQARGAGAAALVGNTIYFTGGMDQTRTIDEATTYALDLTNLSAGWVQKADLPNGRNHVAAAAVNGYFYVIGGQHGQEDGQAAQNEVDRYDPSSDTWTKVASLPVNAGKSHITEATFVYNGRIVVVGGETGYNDPQRYIVDYDPVTNTWNQLGLLPAARSTTIAGVVNGQLIVTTGNSPDATTTTWIGTLS